MLRSYRRHGRSMLSVMPALRLAVLGALAAVLVGVAVAPPADTGGAPATGPGAGRQGTGKVIVLAAGGRTRAGAGRGRRRSAAASPVTCRWSAASPRPSRPAPSAALRADPGGPVGDAGHDRPRQRRPGRLAGGAAARGADVRRTPRRCAPTRSWRPARAAQGVTVAVLDTGVSQHADLAGRLVSVAQRPHRRRRPVHEPLRRADLRRLLRPRHVRRRRHRRERGGRAAARTPASPPRRSSSR